MSNRNTPLGVLHAVSEIDTKRRLRAKVENEHRMEEVGTSHQWKCRCGEWSMKTPNRGAFGHTGTAARMAQLRMVHRRHVDSAISKAMK